jgi:hypothetical protein
MSVKMLLKILVVFFGCLSFSSVLAYDQTPLKKAITNFAKDEPTSFSLGAFPPVHSKNVDIVLSHKVEATPLLLKALHSDNWLVVAQSTYCLELLKVTGARSKMIELENKWDSLPIEHGITD